MDTLHTLLFALALSIGINSLMFLVAFRYRTDRLTDISYALSFAVLAAVAFMRGHGGATKAIVLALIVFWAARLGLFLLMRIWKTGVDHRFDAMRGSFWQFGKFWELQAVSVWIILLPSLLAFTNPTMRVTSLSILGALLWLIGVTVEGFADIQKYRFSQNPANKGTWIDSGLWHYSRHPNYFGEMLVWLGVYLFVVPSLTVGQALIGLIGPAFIILLLSFVSGIPPLEKGADARWGTNKKYQAYKRQTSILVPLPPKKTITPR